MEDSKPAPTQFAVSDTSEANDLKSRIVAWLTSRISNLRGVHVTVFGGSAVLRGALASVDDRILGRFLSSRSHRHEFVSQCSKKRSTANRMALQTILGCPQRTDHANSICGFVNHHILVCSQSANCLLFKWIEGTGRRIPQFIHLRKML